MSSYNDNLIDLQLCSFFENSKPIQRFRQRMMRKSIKSQRSVFKGQAAAHIAAMKNKTLDDRKKYYRQMYLQMKAREQQMYGSQARSQAMKR